MGWSRRCDTLCHHAEPAFSGRTNVRQPFFHRVAFRNTAGQCWNFGIKGLLGEGERRDAPGLATQVGDPMLGSIARFPRVPDCVSSGRLVTCAKEAAGTRDGPSGTKRGEDGAR